MVTPVGSLIFDGAKIMNLELPKVYHPSSPLTAIKAEANSPEVVFVDGTDVPKAEAEARKANLVVVFAEEWRTESQDRPSLNLPDGHDQLIDSVASANPRTVVVLESGGAVAMPGSIKCRAC